MEKLEREKTTALAKLGLNEIEPCESIRLSLATIDRLTKCALLHLPLARRRPMYFFVEFQSNGSLIILGHQWTNFSNWPRSLEEKSLSIPFPGVCPSMPGE